MRMVEEEQYDEAYELLKKSEVRVLGHVVLEPFAVYGWRCRAYRLWFGFTLSRSADGMLQRFGAFGVNCKTQQTNQLLEKHLSSICLNERRLSLNMLAIPFLNLSSSHFSCKPLIEGKETPLARSNEFDELPC